MSGRPVTIATVVEGPTDHLVLEAILRRLFPDARILQPLQPNASAPQTGEGWKGIRRWCQQVRPTLSTLLSPLAGPAIDLLVIQIDGDIVAEADLQDGITNPV